MSFCRPSSSRFRLPSLSAGRSAKRSKLSLICRISGAAAVSHPYGLPSGLRLHPPHWSRRRGWPILRLIQAIKAPAAAR